MSDKAYKEFVNENTLSGLLEMACDDLEVLTLRGGVNGGNLQADMGDWLKFEDEDNRGEQPTVCSVCLAGATLIARDVLPVHGGDALEDFRNDGSLLNLENIELENRLEAINDTRCGAVKSALCKLYAITETGFKGRDDAGEILEQAYTALAEASGLDSEFYERLERKDALGPEMRKMSRRLYDAEVDAYDAAVRKNIDDAMTDGEKAEKERLADEAGDGYDRFCERMEEKYENPYGPFDDDGRPIDTPNEDTVLDRHFAAERAAKAKANAPKLDALSDLMRDRDEPWIELPPEDCAPDDPRFDGVSNTFKNANGGMNEDEIRHGLAFYRVYVIPKLRGIGV